MPVPALPSLLERKPPSRRALIGGAIALLVVAGAVVAAGGWSSRDESRSLAKTADQRLSLPGAETGGAYDTAVTTTVPLPSQPSAAGASDAGAGRVDPNGPRIVKHATLEISLGKGGFRAAFDRAAGVAGEAGGFVVTSTSATEDGTASGELVLRVPVDRFDDVRRKLAGLGDVEREQLEGDDVSSQLVDLDARLRGLATQEEAFRALLLKAKSVGEVLEVQNQLGGVRTQIEQLTAQKANLDDAAALATVRVRLFEPGAVPVLKSEPNPDPVLVRSVERAAGGALAVVGGMVVVLGVVAPFALLALIAWGISRLRRRPAAV